MRNPQMLGTGQRREEKDLNTGPRATNKKKQTDSEQTETSGSRA